MIEVATEEMHGSDRISWPETDYERALGWYGTASTRTKWRALRSARVSTLKKCLTSPTL